MQSFVHIVEKYATPTNNDVQVVEKYPTPSSGPRELCEDIVCTECNEHLSNGAPDKYKSCKQKCFIDKKDKIEDCCRRQCKDLPIRGGNGKQVCLDACATQLDYGNQYMLQRKNSSQQAYCNIL